MSVTGVIVISNLSSVTGAQLAQVLRTKLGLVIGMCAQSTECSSRYHTWSCSLPPRRHREVPKTWGFHESPERRRGQCLWLKLFTRDNVNAGSVGTSPHLEVKQLSCWAVTWIPMDACHMQGLWFTSVHWKYQHQKYRKKMLIWTVSTSAILGIEHCKSQHRKSHFSLWGEWN